MKNRLRIVNIGIIIFALIIIVLYFLFFNSSLIRQPIKVTATPEMETIVNNLDTPWAIDFLPSGEMLFTERGGKVSLFDLETKELIKVGEIKVSEVSESGLLGIAVDPDFESNSFIYIYYTYDKGNKVSRFTLEDNKLINEFILLDNIPNAQFHDGGRIKFGPDGKLYITTGDATVPSSAQEYTTLAGKILRINADGSIPKDNPFVHFASVVETSEIIRTEIWSYGHRNPQGIAWNSNGEFFASEHGPTKNDELNKIEKGKNYGWPTKCEEQEGINDIKPIRCYTEFTLAPSGIAFYEGDLYVAGLRGNQLRRIEFDEGYTEVINEEVLFDNLGRIREVVEHDGWLYIATNNRDGRGVPREGDDKILRIKIIRSKKL